MSDRENDDDPEKVLGVETTIIPKSSGKHEGPTGGVGVSGGPLGGGTDSSGGGDGSGSSGGSEPPGPGSVEVETKFRAACDSLHPPPPGEQFLGKARSGPTAFADAQADADEHNRKNPTHAAGVIEA